MCVLCFLVGMRVLPSAAATIVAAAGGQPLFYPIVKV